MTGSASRLIAILESVGVFLLILAFFWAGQASPLKAWEARVFRGGFIEYIAAILVVLLVLALKGKGLEAYGLSLKNLRRQLWFAAVGFLPFAAASLSLNLVNWKQWTGSLVISIVLLALLGLLAWLLRKDPGMQALCAASGLLAFVPALQVQAAPFAGSVLRSFLFFFLLVGPVEEILFRGYIQSRLGEAFGCPYRFSGAQWGWGTLLSALLFASWHVFSPASFNPFLGKMNPALTWGLWTFFAGLVFSYLRERSGGVTAPAILHGVLNFF